MDDDAEGAATGASVPASPFALRRVLPATAAERLMREEGMARALRFGAKPYRDAEGKGRHIPFKEANLAPVEPWKGGGLSHIIAKHGPEVLDDVVETIAKGILIRRVGRGEGERVVLLHRGHEAILSLYRGEGREVWLLSGYKSGTSDINFDLSQLKNSIFFKAN